MKKVLASDLVDYAEFCKAGGAEQLYIPTATLFVFLSTATRTRVVSTYLCKRINNH